MTQAEKTAIIAEYATHEGDTGSPEVQIAVLTKRINDLTEHLKTIIQDVVFSRWLVTEETFLHTFRRMISKDTVQSLQDSVFVSNFRKTGRQALYCLPSIFQIMYNFN